MADEAGNVPHHPSHDACVMGSVVPDAVCGAEFILDVDYEQRGAAWLDDLFQSGENSLARDDLHVETPGIAAPIRRPDLPRLGLCMPRFAKRSAPRATWG